MKNHSASPATRKPSAVKYTDMRRTSVKRRQKQASLVLPTPSFAGHGTVLKNQQIQTGFIIPNPPHFHASDYKSGYKKSGREAAFCNPFLRRRGCKTDQRP
jgi:hypothetical protein